MDEAEKYKQRLEAIAEKRRQQDEQDRARREMEDEKLRLQQLKRKSLRDQWLMEGAPLSPSSADAQNARSPLWASQTQEMEKNNDGLQSECQLLAEEKEKEHMEDGQVQEAEKVAEAEAETTGDEAKTNKEMEGTAVVSINGGGGLEDNYKASEQDVQSNTNGPIGASEDIVSMTSQPRLSFGVSEAEPVHVSDVNTNKKEEDDEEGLVIRAECVIITDEGDDTPEDLLPQDDQQENVQSAENPLPNEEQEEGREAEEDVIVRGAAETEENEAAESTAEAQLATGDRDVEDDKETNENKETKAKEQDTQSEDLTSVQLQPPATAVEGTTVASLPVYSEALPPKSEGEAPKSAEGAEAVLKDQDPATSHGHFQEVPLADSQEKQRIEAGPGEQEPLLSQARAPNSHAEPAAANSPANTETLSPKRDSRGGGSEPSKCKCCSVM